jgi:Na+/proline symporter
MQNINAISQYLSIIIILITSLLFAIIGILYSRKFLDLNNYLVANRSIGIFSLTTSFIASALGSWILFGPASAASWGGIGAVIGYSLGTAFPFFLLIYLGKIFRSEFPNGKTLIEVIRLKFGNNLFKLILILSFFYMTVFLIAEVTAVSILIRYLSGTNLWITSFIIISCSMIYTIYGGLRASIFTDNIQFIFLLFLLIITFFAIVLNQNSNFSINVIKENKPLLLSADYYPNYTAGLTFFIAVAATNLFHQGNWQRVYAARNFKVLKTSLIISFLFSITIVFFIGFCGLISTSLKPDVNPDLAFFSLILDQQNIFIVIIIVFLAISLTVSSIDTILNAVSSLIIVDGKKTFIKNFNTKKASKLFIVLLSIITFLISSQGISILYLFLLADLFCCAAVISIFFSFYKKSLKEQNIYFSIILGLVGGLMFFPTPDFSKSLLVGILLPISIFPEFISKSLLFCSFLIATLLPILTFKITFLQRK